MHAVEDNVTLLEFSKYLPFETSGEIILIDTNPWPNGLLGQYLDCSCTKRDQYLQVVIQAPKLAQMLIG